MKYPRKALGTKEDKRVGTKETFTCKKSAGWS